jgi:hypothetical protein
MNELQTALTIYAAENAGNGARFLYNVAGNGIALELFVIFLILGLIIIADIL